MSVVILDGGTTRHVLFVLFVGQVIILLRFDRLQEAGHEGICFGSIEWIGAMRPSIVDKVTLGSKPVNRLSCASIVDQVDDVDQDALECLNKMLARTSLQSLSSHILWCNPRCCAELAR